MQGRRGFEPGSETKCSGRAALPVAGPPGSRLTTRLECIRSPEVSGELRRFGRRDVPGWLGRRSGSHGLWSGAEPRSARATERALLGVADQSRQLAHRHRGLLEVAAGLVATHHVDDTSNVTPSRAFALLTLRRIRSVQERGSAHGAGLTTLPARSRSLQLLA